MKVTVLVTTYNHEKYIAQALDSVLMQKTNFDYEIIISEDCSTDRTRSIVVDFQRRNPRKIHLLLPRKNLGCGSGNRIFAQAFESTQSQYVALLDGDPRDDLDLASPGIVKMLDDRSWEPKAAFAAVAECYRASRR